MNFQKTNSTAAVGAVFVFAVAAVAGGRYLMTDASTSGERPTNQPPPLGPKDDSSSAKGVSNESAAGSADGHETATFGAGCFWCTEAVFQQLKGVQRVVSGYSGGHRRDPTYSEICTGATGHAEVIQLTFDPKQISYAELLEVFWQTHDPTTLNRQGNDRGTQYRSVIFYHDDAQRQAAEHFKRKLDESGAFSGPIVTEISPFTEFFPAEGYHQNYFADNPSKMYCAAIIRPKVEKVRKAFEDKLK
ncbi:MAG TPA: peptide-methionine (S)-S-oxide reductase MsrA [Pirellulales bacterium]|nr:peptide-methionine (S)-S-oxide reductase MsrA [Pirellulales bacterium]